MADWTGSIAGTQRNNISNSQRMFCSEVEPLWDSHAAVLPPTALQNLSFHIVVFNDLCILSLPEMV